MIITERFECPHCGAIYRLKREKVSGVDESAREANIEVGGANIFGPLFGSSSRSKCKEESRLNFAATEHGRDHGRENCGLISSGRLAGLTGVKLPLAADLPV